MNLEKLLTESLHELSDRPSYFAPKIITSLMGSLWILSALNTMQGALTASEPDLEALKMSLAIFPFVLFLGVLSPVIVAEMVKNQSSLFKASKKSLKNAPRLAAASIALIILFSAATIPAYIGMFAFLVYSNLLLLLLGLSITIGLVILLSYGIYFLPVTLTENSVSKSLEASFEASNNYRKEVSILLIISFALLLFSSMSTGAMQGLGVTGFILGRVLSSVITTYTLIVSPKAYMEIN